MGHKLLLRGGYTRDQSDQDPSQVSILRSRCAKMINARYKTKEDRED